ncbi:MAG: helix-turn-helix domain-containing protein [Acetatifactor sp.]|nr:helix-turn-helix domain-containing protein [Acetatifactor sp.]MDE7043599.1 helix-turn-helix domain-containing protein [Acetatifactor sp.]
MDQKKIGMFLKELRREKQLTQEQLAEVFGVTNRSISRWENGVNMPDFDLVIEIADYYNVSIEEILDGERKNEMMDQKTEQALLNVADYENQDKMKFSRRLCGLFIVGIIAFIVYAVIDMLGLSSTGVYEAIASFALGLVFGGLVMGALVTSRYMAKVQAFKQRLLNKTWQKQEVKE